MTPAQLTRLTEAEARELIEATVWLDGPVCPLCSETEKITKMGGKAAEKGLYKCKACRRNFSVRKGTIFEDSPIPLRDWLYAITRMCCSKKGVSAHQIHRELGITYKSAWHLCHRIRWAFRDDSDVMMDGTIEVDETYVGPRKPRLADTIFNLVDLDNDDFFRERPLFFTSHLGPGAQVCDRQRDQAGRHPLFFRLTFVLWYCTF